MSFPSGQRVTQVVHGCSSARVVRCWVKSRNERNPYLSSQQDGHSRETARDNLEEGMTSNHHALMTWPHVPNGVNKVKRSREASQITKITFQFDCSLQLDYMKLESLVIADQNAAVNTFPGLVHTARHTMGVENARSR